MNYTKFNVEDVRMSVPLASSSTLNDYKTHFVHSIAFQTEGGGRFSYAATNKFCTSLYELSFAYHNTICIFSSTVKGILF